MSNLPATFEQRVRERINEAIADLIPSSELEELVKSQVSNFRRADLPEMIRTEIRMQFAAAIKAEFAKAEYAPTWAQHGGMAGGEAVRKIIEENAGAVLSSMIGGMVQMTIQQMQGNMPRMY